MTQNVQENNINARESQGYLYKIIRVSYAVIVARIFSMFFILKHDSVFIYVIELSHSYFRLFNNTQQLPSDMCVFFWHILKSLCGFDSWNRLLKCTTPGNEIRVDSIFYSL